MTLPPDSHVERIVAHLHNVVAAGSRKLSPCSSTAAAAGWRCCWRHWELSGAPAGHDGLLEGHLLVEAAAEAAGGRERVAAGGGRRGGR